MNKKKLKVLFITIPIAIIGAILLIRGVTTDVPPMSSDAWFDAESQKSFMCFLGGFILFIGFITSCACISAYFSSKTWNTMTKNIPYYLQHRKNEKVCEYCKTINNKSDFKCKSCGAPLRSSNSDTGNGV